MKHLLLLIILGAISNLSCNECRGVRCEETITVPSCIEECFPYNIGDIVKFVSEMGDTVEFICTDRNFYHQVQDQPDGILQQTCCGPWDVESIRIDFDTLPNGDFLSIDNYNSGIPGLNFNLRINNKTIYSNWVFDSGCQPVEFNGTKRLATKVLINHTFHGVYTSRYTDGLVYFEPNKLGIVGFIIDDIEWIKQ